MTPTSIKILARLAWAAPILLIALSINQVIVAFDLRETIREGTPAVAEIIETEVSGRTDVTFDYVSLRIPMPDGSELVRERMALPHSLAPMVVDETTVDVLVAPGAAQEVVISQIAQTQWRIAAINSAMSFVAFLIAALGVFAWNRYLARHGDPAQRTVAEANAAG